MFIIAHGMVELQRPRWYVYDNDSLVGLRDLTIIVAQDLTLPLFAIDQYILIMIDLFY